MRADNMTTETQHTPTPYMVQRLNHADGETWIQIGFMDGGREIGPLAELVGGAVKHDAPVWHPVAVMKYLVASDAQVLANAEFIVKACNSHQALLDALERINTFACYASEENTKARAEMLIQIGLTAREAIANAAR